MPNCLECFSADDIGPRDLQLKVDKEHPGFYCECEKCSPHSPGVVSDDEILGFLLIDPLHYDEERDVVVPEAFVELTQRDLSLLRTRHTDQKSAENTRQKLIDRGRKSIPPKERLIDEVCICDAGPIRAETDSNNVRYFAVYDTALNDCVGHASVFTHTNVLETKLLRKEARNRIHQLFTAYRVKFSEFLEILEGEAPASE